MEQHPDPVVGQWYRNLEEERLFEVVALDEEEGTVEVQYFESEITEFDLDAWYEIPLESAAAPEDWSGPYDDLVNDDFGDTEAAQHAESWSNPLDNVE